MDSSILRRQAKTALRHLSGAAEVPRTSRTTLLALSELARRHGATGSAAEPLRDLTPFELRVFSQNGEDGVIAELLRRCEAPGRWFVEFGAATGAENNCAVLADVFGWSGLFMEAGEAEHAELERKYRGRSQVRTARAMVDPDNVEQLFGEHGVPAEPDLVSIDVDGIDYYIWEALESFRPRVVVIEYNGDLDPHRRLVQPRDAAGSATTTAFGASLAALAALGEAKGYRLVHTELTGTNAFFVRADLPGSYPQDDAVPRRTANRFLLGERHPDAAGARFVDLDAQP